MDSISKIQKTSTKDSQVSHLIVYTCNLLQELMEEDLGRCYSIFNSNQIPRISLSNYLHRLYKYAKFSPECIIVAILYMDRYNLQHPEFILSLYNVHKILLTCLILATKFQDDQHYDNKTFEVAGGVNATQIHQFEIEITTHLNFELFVSQIQYEQLLTTLEKVYNTQRNIQFNLQNQEDILQLTTFQQ